MAQNPEDFKFPVSVVQKIIKDSISDGVIVHRDARDAISRAASIFILYTTTCANTIAANAKRKTLTAQDVIDSINDMGFDEFISDLIKWHDTFRKEKIRKEKQKAKKSAEITQQHQNNSSVRLNNHDYVEIIDLDNDDFN